MIYESGLCVVSFMNRQGVISGVLRFLAELLEKPLEFTIKTRSFQTRQLLGHKLWWHFPLITFYCGQILL